VSGGDCLTIPFMHGNAARQLEPPASLSWQRKALSARPPDSVHGNPGGLQPASRGNDDFFFLPFTKRTFRSTFTHGNFTGEFFFSSAGTSWPRRRRFPYQTTTNLLGKTLSPEGTSMIVLNRKKFSNDVGT